MSWLIATTLFVAGATAPPERVTQLHDIRFLTREVPQFPAEVWPRAGNIVLGQEAVYEFGGLYFGAPEPAISFAESSTDVWGGEVAAPPGRGIAPEILIELIQRNIAEDSWANERNSIAAGEDTLVVTQTKDVQEAIATFLEGLRAQRAQMVTVDVALVPLEALGVDALPATPWISDQEFDAAVQRAKEKVVPLSLTAYNEQLVSGFSGTHATRLADLEINQTGVIPVSNPVIEKLPLGLSVEVRPSSVATTGWYRVDLRLARLETAGDPVRRETFFGEIDFLPLREQSIETVLLLRDGRAAIAGTLRAVGAEESVDDFAALVRIRPWAVGKEPDGGAPAGGEFIRRVHDVAFLLEAFPSEPLLLTKEFLDELITTNVDPDAWQDARTSLEIEAGGRLLSVTARRETHEKVEAFLRERMAERARVARVETQEIEGRIELLRDCARQMEAGVWPVVQGGSASLEKGLRRSLHSVTWGIVGSQMETRAVEARTYLGDIEGVSGGTGFAIISIPDPVLMSAGGGFDLTSRVQPVHGPRHVLLDLELLRCRTAFDRTAEVRVAAEIGETEGPPRVVDAEGKTGEAPPRRIVWIPYRLDLPSQEYHLRSLSERVGEGTPTVLEIRSGPDGTGRLTAVKIDILPAAMERR